MHFEDSRGTARSFVLLNPLANSTSNIIKAFRGNPCSHSNSQLSPVMAPRAEVVEGNKPTIRCNSPLQPPLPCHFSFPSICHLRPIGERIQCCSPGWCTITSDQWVFQIVCFSYALLFFAASPHIPPFLPKRLKRSC